MTISTTDNWARRLAEQALGDGATIPSIDVPVTPDDPRLYIRCAASRGDADGQTFWPRTPGARVHADLHGANLAWASLHGVDLTGADLTGADLHGVDLSWAKLPGLTG